MLRDTNPNMELPFGFAGGIRDEHTGLVRFLHRDYDPGVARWTTPDPLGLRGGDVDVYGDCLDDPIGGIDPLGLFRFGKRPLDGLPETSPGDWTDKNNLELKHEHGFYEDGSGDNIGFGSGGFRKSEDPAIYRFDDEHFEVRLCAKHNRESRLDNATY